MRFAVQLPSRGGDTPAFLRVEETPGAAEAAANIYTASHYHQPSDEYSPDWDWSGAVQDLELYEMLGRELANGKQWPNWFADSEFRAVRDASRKDMK